MARTKGVHLPNVTTAQALKNLPPAGSIDSKSLTQKAMLVSVSISQWTARKQDKVASQKVSDDFGNAKEQGSYRKLLVAQTALKRTSSAVTAIRDYVASHTLPWNNNGYNMLPSVSYIEFTADLRKLINELNNAADEVADNYDALKDQGRILLGGLFNEDDYPTARQVRAKFSVSIEFTPLPAAEDFRVSLQGAEVAQIQASITENANRRIQSAMTDLYERLYKVVSKAADSLKDPKAIFHDTLIGNIVEITELLPKLNITGDPALEELRKIVEQKLCHTEPAELRKDINARKTVANDAQAILDAMGAYMGD
jgi:hypothetical protein